MCGGRKRVTVKEDRDFSSHGTGSVSHLSWTWTKGGNDWVRRHVVATKSGICSKEILNFVNEFLRSQEYLTSNLSDTKTGLKNKDHNFQFLTYLNDYGHVVLSHGGGLKNLTL